MRPFLFCLLSFAVSLCASGVVDSSEPEANDERLAQLVSELVLEKDMSGVVVVARDGETVFKQAFNIDPLQSEFEITTDSAFALASLTKSFSAVLVLDQVSAGRIGLDETISAYLPDFDADYADAVTVRQLLQNRSGIPHYVDIPGWFDPEVKARFTPESWLAELASLELKFSPGEEYYYSNANYYLLGLILESATGQSYEALLAERILRPLGLENTGHIYSSGESPVVPTYLREADSYEQVKVTNPSLFRAAASQYSTAEDLAAFGEAVLSGSLLDEQMLDLLLDEKRPMSFTVGALPLRGEEVEVVTYNGELVGTTTMLTMFPEQGGTIVILSNNNTPYLTLVELTLEFAQSAFRRPIE